MQWRRLDADYELARSRILLGRALQLLGDDAGALLKFRSARAAFDTHGAVIDTADAADRAGEATLPGGLSAREVEVLRLVAAGESKAQIADELTLSVKTVARHLSNSFTKLDVGSHHV